MAEMAEITDTTCAVCGRAARAGANRVGGADVCDLCFHGDAPRRIRERGWAFQIRQFDQIRNDEGERYYYTEASLVLGTSTPIQLHCRRRTLGWRLLGLVKPGLTSGDELFDRHVHVVSQTPAITASLLADEGVQSILLDMLGEGSWITVKGGTIEVSSRRTEYVPEARFSAEMCVLASHVARLHG